MYTGSSVPMMSKHSFCSVDEIQTRVRVTRRESHPDEPSRARSANDNFGLAGGRCVATQGERPCLISKGPDGIVNSFFQTTPPSGLSSGSLDFGVSANFGVADRFLIAGRTGGSAARAMKMLDAPRVDTVLVRTKRRSSFCR